MIKILVIGGHGANDPGACSSHGIERDEARKVVNEMVSQFKGYEGLQVDVYPTSRNCYDDYVKGTLQVNFSNYDYVFEVHFNSSSNSAANGTEIFVTNSEESTVVEQKVVNKLVSLGFSNRGVKRENFGVIYHAKSKGVSSALVEICFISNNTDMDNYKSKFKEVCNAMVTGIAEGFELKPKVVETTKSSANSDVILYKGFANGKQFTDKCSVESLMKILETQFKYGYYEIKLTRC